MKYFSISAVRALLLFMVMFSTIPFQHDSRYENSISRGTTELTQSEMSSIVGGDVTITIYGGSNTIWWALGGAALGGIIFGAAGIFPGAFIGALFGAIFGG